MPASSSMADRRATITLRAARRREPTAIVDVHTTCMAIGIEATSSTTTVASASRAPSSRTIRVTKMMEHSTSDKMSSTDVTRNRTCWKRPVASTSSIRPAALPKNVLRPVAHTTALHSPRFTAEPILALPPGGSDTGRDSPVSAAWSTWIGSSEKRMQSAGTMSPMTSSMRSPGTSRRLLMLRHVPLRITRHSGASDCFSAAMALPAFFSSM
mmetsp:Transcript_59513/g.143669  ORF Transcript_59513/g.143669 Transcript_59513/m.143669 type:complete len:212 (+) Transcript_59513:849-1484(+)